MEDIASGTAFLEVVLSDFGKAQGIIKLSKSKKTSVGGDGGTVKCQADFGVELEPERGLLELLSNSCVACLLSRAKDNGAGESWRSTSLNCDQP